MKRIRIEKLVRVRPTEGAPPDWRSVELFELPDGRHVVHVGRSRDGIDWKESVHTPDPLPPARAQTAFDEALAGQVAQGYRRVDAGAPPAAAPSPAPSLRQADATLLASLHADRWQLLPPTRRSRIAWRVGERRLASGVPRLVELIESGEPVLDYSIAWAIGRCGDAGAWEAMRELTGRARTPMVARMARWAALALWPQAQRGAEATRIVDDWPAVLRRAWADASALPVQEGAALLHQQMAEDQNRGSWQGISRGDWLGQLFELSILDPVDQGLARTALRAIAGSLPLAAGSFRAWRQLYKGAEFIGDYRLLGVLHQRLETQRAAFRSGGVWATVNGRWIEIAKEITRDNSRLAYSHRTRDYLRRRTWRSLRRLALAGDADEAPWLQLAMGVLLAADDAEATRGSDSSQWLVLMHLLHGHDPAWEARRGGLFWRPAAPSQPASAAGSASAAMLAPPRTEAWPERWDRHPQALLQLLQQARCAQVHAFASRALQDNTPFCAALEDAALTELLASSWADAARFALGLVRARIAAGADAASWLGVLLASPLQEARAEALALIAQAPARYCHDRALLLRMLCSSETEVRQASRLLLQAGSNDTALMQSLCGDLRNWLTACSGTEAALTDICRDLRWALQGPLREAAAAAPVEALLPLFDHPAPVVVRTAAQWLLLHPASVQALPPQTLARLLRSEDEQLRSAGVQLFGALPESTQIAQPELFATFCTSPQPEVRAAIAPALANLIPKYPAFGAALMPLLRDALFRAEPAAGVTDQLLHWLTGPLAEHTRAGESAATLRLLQARAKGAQRLGEWLLPQQPPESFSVLQTADLGRVDAAAARQWAMAQLAARPERTLAQLDDALRIFDSRWEDARQWAREWFAGQGDAKAWTPALLVRLCDHKDPGAQRLGRELLGQHFDVADITTYLLQLSQHPSPGMQLFVTNWLASAASERPEVLQRLEPYFISVLSQANRGRLAKARVMQFLAAQAGHSEAIARIVARVFARQAVSGAIGERAQYIAGLRAILARHPQLDNPVQATPVRAVAPRRMPVEGPAA